MRLIMFLIFMQCSSLLLADVIHLTNIKGYSHDGEKLNQFNELLFNDETGEILTLDQVSEENTKVIDGGGKVILPGLHDAHGHILGYGISRLLVDLRGYKSLQDTVSQTK